MSGYSMNFKESLKGTLPEQIWNFGRSAWYGLVRAKQWPAATFHPWRLASLKKLNELKDIHRGQRGFILGNGPSLNHTDLSRLRDEYTFGLNRVYLLFPELGFATTYYLSVNDLVVEQCAEDIRKLTIPKFISWRTRTFFKPTEDTVFLHTTYSGPRFARDVRQRLWEGATVTYVALQLAFHMGFEQVILIGVDHSFSTQGKPNTVVVSQGDDHDHFDTRYFGRGFRWQLPDLDTSQRAYRLANRAYLEANRQVIDATIGGKLNVFPKVSYDSLF